MKILVLGGNGMLGHHFLPGLQGRHDVRVTLRDEPGRYSRFGIFNDSNSFFNIDVTSLPSLIKLFELFEPDVVVNATGITKQLAGSDKTEVTIEVNALFPHKLARICKQYGVRMVQFSSDCIFSGARGKYIEADSSDADDLYGKTKYLGEVNQSHVVTLRKSTIGLELSGFHGLIEWFLAQKGDIKGFRHAIYSGLISTELVRVVEMILMDFPELSGIWNVASTPINKYDLLVGLKDRLQLNGINIIPDDEFKCDRSLDGSRFEKLTGYKAPGWDSMLDELAQEIITKKV